MADQIVAGDAAQTELRMGLLKDATEEETLPDKRQSYLLCVGERTAIPPAGLWIW
jgi:hypothetical protein